MFNNIYLLFREGIIPGLLKDLKRIHIDPGNTSSTGYIGPSFSIYSAISRVSGDEDLEYL